MNKSNGYIERMMQEADERLRRVGWENASTQDVMLVGFKYLGDQYSKSQKLEIHVNWKLALPAGLVIGSSLVSLLGQILG